MSQLETVKKDRLFQVDNVGNSFCPDEARGIMRLLGVYVADSEQFLSALPFSLNDTRAGSESELQVAVEGIKDAVDLPKIIEQSNYFQNIIKRSNAGESPRQAVTELEHFLQNNNESVWENSWVRFPKSVLSDFAGKVLDSDLRADKRNPISGLRSDIHRFLVREQGEEIVRVPVSYLLKLSLADVIGLQRNVPESVRRRGVSILSHFLNDNTSPETLSFYVVPLRVGDGMGGAVARETSTRFLLTQLLAMYANKKFLLQERGQKVRIYFSAHPPVRQKKLNEIITDSFYRELFMNPCLSGWDAGEEKYHYMHLCHQVLSRSQLNAVAKLREADIITGNLVVLPNTSNISLANNGTHISLSSKKITDHLRDSSSGFTGVHEKYLGDLVIKMVEHFLPLFVGAYSAAPYRMDFSEFRPEKALGFLPHELDYTHLRMIWRRWKKKAHLKFLGGPITPFGPVWLDRAISTLFRLKGDFISDFRLIDYLVALMSTDQSPALDGTTGNDVKLKQDLADLGIFDTRMSLYMIYKLREFKSMGFSGFEGRYYSLFYSLKDDIGKAVEIQTLLNALAFKYIAEGNLTHAHIPDEPVIESERRQIFFDAAIGIPTFYVRKNTRNIFLKRIIARTNGVRASHRYPEYLRIYNLEYRRALIHILRQDAAGLIEMLNMRETIDDLQQRIDNPSACSVVGKVTEGILNTLNVSSPMCVSSNEFNRAAEKYYREDLRALHLAESFQMWEERFAWLFRKGNNGFNQDNVIRLVLKNRDSVAFLTSVKNDVLKDTVSVEDLIVLIHLVLITIDHDARLYGENT
ncbi:MAG: hypothetical protein MRJ65_01315 [Candidatus Brocadiaceae bacterium]|nr:hypothetical protein [Candidatus Brocadiaceae bacterium]